MPQLKRAIPEVCSNYTEHTLEPEGYIAWHLWAEKMARTHKQVKCPTCGKYVIWKRRTTNETSVA